MAPAWYQCLMGVITGAQVPIAEVAPLPKPVIVRGGGSEYAHQWFLGALRTLGERYAEPYAKDLFSYQLETGLYRIVYRKWQDRLEPMSIIFDGRREPKESFFQLLTHPQDLALSQEIVQWALQTKLHPYSLPDVDLSDFKFHNDDPVQWSRIPPASTWDQPFFVPNFVSVYSAANDYVLTGMPYVIPRLKLTDKVLVMGSGSGVETVWLAKLLGLRVDAVDKNPVAVANTEYSIWYHGVRDQAVAWQSDLFSKVSQKYDAIIFFAPLAVEPDWLSADSNRFDVGGNMLWTFLAQARNHLNPGGRIYLLAEPSRKTALAQKFKTETIVRFISGATRHSAGLVFDIFELSL